MADAVPGDCRGTDLIREIREEYAANDIRARRTYIDQRVCIEGEISEFHWDLPRVSISIEGEDLLSVGVIWIPPMGQIDGLSKWQSLMVERNYERHREDYLDWMMEASIGDKVRAVCTIGDLRLMDYPDVKPIPGTPEFFDCLRALPDGTLPTPTPPFPTPLPTATPWPTLTPGPAPTAMPTPEGWEFSEIGHQNRPVIKLGYGGEFEAQFKEVNPQVGEWYRITACTTDHHNLVSPKVSFTLVQGGEFLEGGEVVLVLDNAYPPPLLDVPPGVGCIAASARYEGVDTYGDYRLEHLYVEHRIRTFSVGDWVYIDGFQHEEGFFPDQRGGVSK